MRGVVKRVVLDRGFGFIEPQSGDDLFFHISAVVDGLPFDEQLTERAVLFDEITDQRTGRPRAINVRPA